MSVRQVKVHGHKVWQARVAFQGLRSSRVCESRDAADSPAARTRTTRHRSSSRERFDAGAPG
jgi:hypothetical protein